MRLKTLGELSLEGSDFKQSRPLLLLTYLCLGGPQERRHLAELFWPSSANAVRNLTTVLSRINKVDNDLIEPEGAKLKVSFDCDALSLQKAYDQKDYTEVLDLYQGRFLEGFYLKDIGEELEEWLYQTREALATKVRYARLRVAEQKATEGLFKDAAKEAEQAYLQAGASEPTDTDLERIYKLLLAGESQLAYEVKKEALGYGSELSINQQEAQKLLQASLPEANYKTQPKETAKTIVHNLPKQATPFVGRQEELELLNNQVHEPDCSLLSLIGPGGMGKTRLALALAEKQVKEKQFKDGVTFVSFVSVPTFAGMLPALGDALGISFSGQLEPKEQLFNFLTNKYMLLVLDNLEHLLEGVGLLAELLEKTRDVKLLATSREPLHLRAEHVFEVGGLSIPGEANKLEDYDGVKLFVQHAQRQQRSFRLDAANTPAVVKICQLLDGMPLALELAASWLRFLPLEEISREISKGLDFLEANNRDVPERHRSIRAVFDYSWQRLSKQEQAALRKLAVFQGGFTRETAKEVADVSFRELVSLIDKSLISTTETGRYRRHPLVIQYSQEKLIGHPEEKTQMEERHGHYFLNFIQEHAPRLYTLERKAAIALLEPEFSNIKAAWGWAVKEKRVDDLRDSTDALSQTFLDNNLEALPLFQKAVAGLDEANPDHHMALGYAYIFQSKKTHLKGDAYYLGILQKGMSLLRPLGDNKATLHGSLLSSFLDGGWDETLRLAAQENLALARSYGGPVDIGYVLVKKLQVERNLADFATVSKTFEDAIAELHGLNNYVDLVDLKLCFGAYLVYNKEYTRGRQLLVESLALNEELGFNEFNQGSIYAELGFAAMKQQNYQDASTLIHKALNLAEQQGLTHNQTKALSYLSRIATAQGDQPAALTLIQQFIGLNVQLYYFMEALLALVEYLKSFELPEHAVSIAQLILNHPHTEKRDKDQAQEILDEVADQLPPESYHAAIKHGESLRLEDVTQEALNLTV